MSTLNKRDLLKSEVVKLFDKIYKKEQNYSMNARNFDYLKLHISVLLAGFTGIFAKLISLNEVAIVWYRLVFAFLIFAVMFFMMKKKPSENLKDTLKISGLGALLAIHLMFFFGSIKYSNVSIGVVCYSLVGFFTVFFEPLILKTKFSFKELFYSLIAVFGILLIFKFDSGYRFGIILGVISAALFALYTLFNKVVEVGKSSRSMLFYELFGGALFMSAFLPVYNYFSPIERFLPTGIEWLWIFILAFFCTVLLYLLHIAVLKTLSAFTVSLTGNLEPIYGILFAILFMGEAHDLTITFYIGMVLILASVFLQSVTKKHQDISE